MKQFWKCLQKIKKKKNYYNKNKMLCIVIELKAKICSVNIYEGWLYYIVYIFVFVLNCKIHSESYK